MEKYLIFYLLSFTLASMLSFQGCILDAFNSLTENISLTKEFDISSSFTTYSKTDLIDLSNSTTYQRYQDKIQNISFLRAEFRTLNVSPSDMQSSVTINLQDNNGNLLFSYPLGSIKPADYQNTPYELQLNSTQIGLINSYLSTLSNKTFQATISINNITWTTFPASYNLKAVIDIVSSMKTNL